MNATHTATPSLWWLGDRSFAVRYASITFYLNPTAASVLPPDQCSNADMILCTDADALDPVAVPAMLNASARAKVVAPKSLRTDAVPLHRMTTTDDGLRIEYFKDNLYGRVYSAPAALEGWTPMGGYPKLGYLVRFEGVTVYYAGAAAPYDGLAQRLRPYNPNVAILRIGANAFTPSQAAELARDTGATWLIPAHGPPHDGFVEHLLGHWPAQRFKTFTTPGEKWTVPGLDPQ